MPIIIKILCKRTFLLPQRNHYRELKEEARMVFGSIPDEFVAYWTTRFPRLLLHTWYAMQCIKTEVIFQKYYDEKFNFGPVSLSFAPFLLVKILLSVHSSCCLAPPWSSVQEDSHGKRTSTSSYLDISSLLVEALPVPLSYMYSSA